MSDSVRYLLGSAALCALLAGCGDDKSGAVGHSEADDVGAHELVIDEPSSVETAGTVLSDPLEALPANEAVFLPDSILGEATPLFATGSEPYWTAEIGDGWISFDRPGLPLVEVPLPEFEEIGDELDLSSDGLELVLVKNGCEAETEGLSLQIAYQEVEYIGCAVSANGAMTREAGDTSWKELIEPSLKAIDACLDQADGRRLVLALYPREPGTVGMILGDEVGGYEECGADVDTGELYFLDPMSADQAQDWMSGAAFARTDKSQFCDGGEALSGGIGVFQLSGC